MYQPQDSIGFQLGVIYRKVSNRLAARLKDYDLTPEQWSVMCCICFKEGMNQKEIAERTVKDQPTVTRILNVLHRKGLIMRSSDRADRRAYLIYPTGKGRQVTEETSVIERQHNAAMIEGFDAAQLELLAEAFRRIERNAERYEESETQEASETETDSFGEAKREIGG
ncbi:MarR family transcriptional regulator [Saccharibacillus sp. CPCC 101409]|uniref:MarR family winged helix-turn-helix transcriptional regulator n=1 Tax=Saccharibacillus sp. CPCC 101409 TaxID=3058041 RepID=UPI0026726A8A|nr:MarR family transcriptional regulator [Saccharibacillus sp. CPCC 101409]MDO3410776.1 MarR family transcriptional regulator [Saccharibacillus sp. CPCC 101409]